MFGKQHLQGAAATAAERSANMNSDGALLSAPGFLYLPLHLYFYQLTFFLEGEYSQNSPPDLTLFVLLVQ